MAWTLTQVPLLTHFMPEIAAEMVARRMSNLIIQPDECGFVSLVGNEGPALEGTASNATSVADGDKRVKRRLLMGMEPSPPWPCHCPRPSQGQLDWDEQLL